MTVAIYPPPSFDSILAYISSVTKAGADSLFEWNGDTYVYHQDAVADVDLRDGLVMLAGVTGLTVGDSTISSPRDIVFG